MLQYGVSEVRPGLERDVVGKFTVNLRDLSRYLDPRFLHRITGVILLDLLGSFHSLRRVWLLVNGEGLTLVCQRVPCPGRSRVLLVCLEELSAVYDWTWWPSKGPMQPNRTS